VNALRTFLASLGLAAPLLDSGVCVCGHTVSVHEHHRPGRDCGPCGALCPVYRPIMVADDEVPYLVQLAWLHVIHGRTLARDHTAFAVLRRGGGLELLVHVIAAHVLEERSDIVARHDLTVDVEHGSLPAWLILAHGLGQHRAIRDRLRKLDPGEQRHLAVNLLRYASPQGVAR
jgi:hypothetical protein